jgi:hypothetical protein
MFKSGRFLPDAISKRVMVSNNLLGAYQLDLFCLMQSPKIVRLHAFILEVAK